MTSTQSIGFPIGLSAVMTAPSGNELSIALEINDRFYSEFTSKYYYRFRTTGGFNAWELFAPGDIQLGVIATVTIDGEAQTKTLEASVLVVC